MRSEAHCAKHCALVRSRSLYLPSALYFLCW